MEKKITILHVIETIGVGGAEKSLVQAVNGLPQYRHIIATLFEPDALKEKLKDAKLIKLNATSLFGKLRAIIKLKRIIGEESVDIVHSQLFYSTIIGRLATGKRIPFVFTLQSMLGEDLFNKDIISRYVEKLTYSRNSYLIAVSNAALEDYRKHISVNLGKVKVIQNSIEEKFFASQYKIFIPGRGLKLIAVGNLKPVKNYDYLLDALKQLPPGMAHLDIYGEGVLSEQLQKRITEERIPATLKGTVRDLNKKMSEYDIYLHCSKYEGSSLAVFEAMASGIPVIVSDIPVLRENTGEFAVFSDLQDPGDLAQKLIKIQNGKLDINITGRKGFDWVKTVAHPDVVFAQTGDFYKLILNENSKR